MRDGERIKVEVVGAFWLGLHFASGVAIFVAMCLFVYEVLGVLFP